MSLFGDSAYKSEECIFAYFTYDLDEFKHNWNHQMKSVRISIEWNYMTIASLCKLTCAKYSLRILEAQTTSKIYTVAVLFKNFHVACYGCQTSNYFEYVLPHDYLEKYISQTDFNN